MENIDIAKIFEEVADLLEILDASVFRIRAYRTAARTIATLTIPAESLLKEDGGLEALPGIGKDLAGKIREIIETGQLALLSELTAEVPASLVEVMRIPGLGPKRAKQVYDQLGIETLAGLEQAARAGQLRTLRGWKETMEARVVQGIAELKTWEGRVRLVDADAYIRPLVEHLETAEGLTHIQVAGSYRRRRETVGDVDLLTTAANAKPVMARFLSYPQVKQVLAHGDTKSSIVLRQGLQVDLRVVPEESLGAALHYFTGSKAHNIAVRTLGVKRGLKITSTAYSGALAASPAVRKPMSCGLLASPGSRRSFGRIGEKSTPPCMTGFRSWSNLATSAATFRCTPPTRMGMTA